MAGYKQVAYLRHEWADLPSSIKPVKWDDLKLLECPRSYVTRTTWEILRAVNSTTNTEGNPVRPFRSVCWDDEPKWYRQAVEIVRNERATHLENKRKELKQNGR